MSISLEQLRQATREDAIALLLGACGSRRWAEQVAAAFPMSSRGQLLRAAEAAERSLDRADWLEAFSHHPRIGEASDKCRLGEMASKEQSGMAAADAETREKFLELNGEYERRFGHVFLICATGKSAEEMLSGLKVRLNNDADIEFGRAVAEQKLITRLRLDKLIDL